MKENLSPSPFLPWRVGRSTRIYDTSVYHTFGMDPLNDIGFSDKKDNCLRLLETLDPTVYQAGRDIVLTKEPL